ncbi:M48 family metalloprotease [Carboxydothermus ferrireducens]|uniref:Zn-dependent protease with chaperone function n=1 Tax=Carboxydothermus ferrireducens DSM 11255 TaxID=1119529 RepID=A0ABX2R8Z9_9THEO|nr:M48 family metalloprotease [Carboxydothermus ferrireducens]NYE56337.1 Zn-dependent protease with chaperone function [Carboxydothermus ferrireducens DSM 11255]
MILYAEIATWVVSAALFTFWLSFALAGSLAEATDGYVQGLWAKSLVTILGGLAVNLVGMGLPKIKATKIYSAKVLIDKYPLTTWQCLLTLFNGARSKKVIRNIAYLPGLKQVSKTADGSTLILEDAEPPNKKIFIITLLVLFIGIFALFTTPLLVSLIFRNVKKLLIPYLPLEVIKDLFKYFSWLIIGKMILPYIGTSKKYSFITVRFFSKPLKKAHGFPVFVSPLVSFLSSKGEILGLADPQGRIFIDSEYVKNDNYREYLIAHEAGHLLDHKFKIIGMIISPVLVPWGLLILFTLSSYYQAMGYTAIGKFLNTAGLVLIFLLIFFWVKYDELGEFRADDYAIKLIGLTATEKALEELAMAFKTTPEALYGKSSFDVRLERIRTKKFQNIK